MKTNGWSRLGGAALTSLALLLAGCTDELLEPLTTPDAIPTPNFSHAAGQPTGNHVVAMAGDISADFAAAIEALGGRLVHRLPEIGVATTSGLSDEAAAALAARSDVYEINRDVAVQWIPPIGEFELETQQPSEESDQSGAFFFPFFQWNLRQIDADDAWLMSNQGEGATVAILDTGIDPFHPDLTGRVDVGNSTSVLSPGSSPCDAFFGLPDEATIFDFNFHGSFVSGIVSSNGLAMGSVAPDATLIGVKVLNCFGFGSFGDVIAGITHAALLGVDVINMSLGALLPKDPAFDPLIRALNDAMHFAAIENGVLVVAAAGNSGLNLDKVPFINVPSQNKHVMSVGATGPFQQMDFDQLGFYTNFGKKGVDVMAPGGNFQFGGVVQDGILSVCSTFSIFFPICGTGTFYLLGGNGTSFSAPHAAGTAAVVESQFPGDQDRKALQGCVEKGAEDLGRLGRDPQYGKGRINVLDALTACSGTEGRKRTKRTK